MPFVIFRIAKKDDNKNWIWAVIDINLADLADKTERVNITFPSSVLKRIDRDAKALGESRFGFVARRMLL